MIKEKRVYQIPVSWRVISYVEVEGDSPEAALRIAEVYAERLPLGHIADYEDDSYQIDSDGEIKQLPCRSGCFPALNYKGELLD